jgi:hypothetical protein
MMIFVIPSGGREGSVATEAAEVEESLAFDRFLRGEIPRLAPGAMRLLVYSE